MPGRGIENSLGYFFLSGFRDELTRLAPLFPASSFEEAPFKEELPFADDSLAELSFELSFEEASVEELSFDELSAEASADFVFSSFFASEPLSEAGAWDLLP